MSKSIFETGHAVNISNGKLLIDTCTGFGEKYNPSNEDITIARLLELWTTAKTAQDALSAAAQGMKEPINRRAILFENLRQLITQVLAALNSSKANELVKKDAKGIGDRIRGVSRKTKVAAEGEGPADSVHTISTSHQSYVQRTNAFLDLINLLKTVKEYKPNEPPLQVESLAQLQQQMQSANDGIGTVLQTGEKAELDRNRALYKPNTGLVEVARACRDYVKSVFGSKAAEYKAVTAIRFRDLSKNEKAVL